jgi:hypothetical protein
MNKFIRKDNKIFEVQVLGIIRDKISIKVLATKEELLVGIESLLSEDDIQRKV